MTKFIKIYYDNGKNDKSGTIKLSLPDSCLGIKMITTYEEKLTEDEVVIWP